MGIDAKASSPFESDRSKSGGSEPAIRSQAVAVVGLSGRYPQSEDHYQFWARIAKGANLIEEIPKSRFAYEDYYQATADRKFRERKIICKYGAFIKDHDCFDAEFFDVAHDDVQFMDPQERIALETTWSCIEDAGRTPASLGKKVGVFSGITYNEYQKLLPLSSHATLLTNRVAHYFDFTGPAVTTDAGCCSSLAAINLAMQNLALGTCDAAVVIGANLILHPDHYTSLTGLVSTSGKPVSNPFGVDDGWIPAEGVVSIVLKRLEDAHKDADHIYAVIKSAAIAQDGRTSWFGAFNPNRQADLISENIERAGIRPETISYIEAASNGSSLGDAIEYEGIGKAFLRFTDRRQFCAIGSVKSNAGHGEGVSTLMQLTKLVQQFQTRKLFPVINLETINPNLRTDSSPLYVVKTERDWNPPEILVKGNRMRLPRRATISSFGGGGNLGHLILEEAGHNAQTQESLDRYFIPLSSRSSEQLMQSAEKLLAFLENSAGYDIAYRAKNNIFNMMFTLCTGRVDFNERVVFVAESFAVLSQQLRDFIQGKMNPGVFKRSANVDPQGSTGDADRLLAAGAWTELAQAWADGARIDWQEFFDGKGAQRIPLPTYSFKKTRFEIKRALSGAQPEPGHFHFREAHVAEAASVPALNDDVVDVAAEGQDQADILGIFSRVLKLQAARLDLTCPISDYGLTSLSVLELTKELERHYTSVPKTVFFEARNLGDLRDAILRRCELLPERRGNDRAASAIADTERRKSERRKGYAAQRLDDGKMAWRELGQSTAGRDIAIVGLSGRYPKANTLDELWSNLKNGHDAIEEIPADRWSWQEYFCEDRKKAGDLGKTYGKWGGFLSDLDKFDPLLFNISPLESEFMDPQERLFLEATWEALEDAGYTRESIKRGAQAKGKQLPVGVYVGATWQEYQLYSQTESARNPHAFCTLSYNISARISYFFDFSGESLTLDTACSSSLVAIHKACLSLLDGSNDVAIAGGVNTSVHPNKYVVLATGGFLSTKGRCESFGASGDGYVPAEGVGCVVLKRLEDAERDRDHIYGVIKGSAVNHGGRSNGYSVPNTRAQADVVERALNNASVDPSTISYIEAHGTGTALGDPIEVEGLRMAFENWTKETQFCAIGSLKSNIGHCESAAGIAGLTKVLLQMKYRQLAPSIHSDELNPDIPFEKTPFFVNRSLLPWRDAVDSSGSGMPRMAGISSFGAGGTNAHVIVAEYIAPARTAEAPGGVRGPVIVPLSSKSEAQLKAYAQRLVAYIDRHVLRSGDRFYENVSTGARPDIALADIAYTLQVGRETMPVRAGFVVNSIAELRERLVNYIADQGDGAARGKQERRAGAASDESSIDRLLHARDHEGLLKYWLTGDDVDWNKLYAGLEAGQAKPRRISLPTYVFARKRSWLLKQPPRPLSSELGSAVRHRGARKLESSADTNIFQFDFDAHESFLADHVIQGKSILPGVGYLDIARQALTTGTAYPIRISDVLWMRPAIVSGDRLSLKIRVANDVRGQIRFEIGESASPEAVLCKGASQSLGEPAPGAVDLAALQAQCRQDSFSGDEIYRRYDELGMSYGPSYRGIARVHIGKDAHGAPFVLSRMSSANIQKDIAENFHIYPGILDSALQTSLGLALASPAADGASVSVPFAVDAVNMFAPCPEQCWVWTRLHAGGSAASNVQKLDVSILSEEGKPCVEFIGFALRELPQAKAPQPSATSAADQKPVVFEPVWVEAESVTGNAKERDEAVPDRIVMLADGFDMRDLEELKARKAGTLEFRLLNLEAGSIDEKYRICAEASFELVKHILQQKPKKRILIQLVNRNDDAGVCFEGVASLFATASQENPKIQGQAIQVESHCEHADLIAMLDQCAGTAASNIRRENGRTLVKRLREADGLPLDRAGGNDSYGFKWQEQGVYLITGGLGGIGRVVAETIAGSAINPHIVLVGRSAPNEKTSSALRGLESLSATASYYPCDVAQRSQVDKLIESVLATYGKIDGIYHIAGLAIDNFILNKDISEFQRVLAPKVSGTVNLDEATKRLKLDHFVLFSSIAGAFGNPGQADYSAANGFLDSYAAYRNRLLAQGHRRGRALSINWPFWQDGGMALDRVIVERLQAKGLSPMSNATGLAVLTHLLAAGSPLDNRLVMTGNRQKLLALVSPAESATNNNQTEGGVDMHAAAAASQSELKDLLVSEMVNLVADVLKLDIADIDPEVDMADYGFDSITLVKLGDLINEKFKIELSSAIYFEYPSLSGIGAHLAAEHPNEIAAAFPDYVRASGNADNSSESEILAAAYAKDDRVTPGQPCFAHASATPSADEDAIAIVGLSGRYPKARNVDEFWANILSKHNCTGKISVHERDWAKLMIDADDPEARTAMAEGFCGGFIDNIDSFDARFFDVDDAEAKLMDPQKRLFLEAAWGVLEDAGYTRADLKSAGSLGKVGVFVASMNQHYSELATDEMQGREQVFSASYSSIANAVSSFFDFSGPSVSLDTLSAGALTAIHMACESICSGSCDYAIAGGVNLIVHPLHLLSLNRLKIASKMPQSMCFGSGDGWIPAEGVGAVFLTRLSVAEKMGDQIYGVIKGSSSSHLGRNKTNPKAQAAIISETIGKAKIDPSNIGYIECSANGSALGDVLEFKALNYAFDKFNAADGKFPIGTVQSNIGHPEAASGMAQLTKLLLQLKYKVLAPSRIPQKMNKEINFDSSRFRLQGECEPWKPRNAQGYSEPRTGLITSLGWGGSSSNLIVQEYADRLESSDAGVAENTLLFCLSAKNRRQLEVYAHSMLAYLREHLTDNSPEFVQRIAYTLQISREAMNERLCILFKNRTELIAKLDAFIRSAELADRPDVAGVLLNTVSNHRSTRGPELVGDEHWAVRLDEPTAEHLLLEIGRRWVNGSYVPWRSLYETKGIKKLALPTYPFEETRHWISEFAPRNRNAA